MSILDIVAIIPLAYLAVVAIPLVVTDARVHRLPNKYVLPFILISFLTSIAVAIISADWIRFVITFGVAVATLLFGVYLNGRDILGMGDVKLFVGIVLALSSFSIWFALIAIAVGFVVSVAVTLVRMFVVKSVSAYGTTTIPLGVFTISATLITGLVAVVI
jgi:leader peptidase (prepilin peptidase)/N-methyltransferase